MGEAYSMLYSHMLLRLHQAVRRSLTPVLLIVRCRLAGFGLIVDAIFGFSFKGAPRAPLDS
eukprot:SAG31_NODE_38158_length_298_cov_1.040201_2_plen_60_part_01